MREISFNLKMAYYRESSSKGAFEDEAITKQFLASKVLISLTDIISTSEDVFGEPPTGRRERFQSPPLKSQSALLTLPQRPNFAHIWKERKKKIKVLKRILKFSFSLHCPLLRGESSSPPYSSLRQVFYKGNYSCYR